MCSHWLKITHSFLQHCQVADPDIASDAGYDVLEEHHKKNGITWPPNSKQLHRTLNWDWRLQMTQTWLLTMTMMIMMTMMTMAMTGPPHILHDTPKSHMAQTALIPLSCISIIQTGLRCSPPPRDFGLFFWEWCSHFQSVICTKMSFKNVLAGQLLPFTRRGSFLSLVSYLITIIWICWYVWYRVLSKVWEANAYTRMTLTFIFCALTEIFLARWEDMSTFHGELKKMPWDVARASYNFLPTKAQAVKFKSPQCHFNHIKQEIMTLLTDGEFLHDGVDHEVMSVQFSWRLADTYIGPYKQSHKSCNCRIMWAILLWSHHLLGSIISKGI